MDESSDTNAEIWKSPDIVRNWRQTAEARERTRAAHRRTMAELLPYDEQDAFTFLDLGAGTGAASSAILTRYPRSTAVLADFSPQMMGEGEREMQPFAGRFRFVEFDTTSSDWPAAIPATLDAVVSSMFVHHLPDHRKQSLFTEIFAHLAPGGWYLNYDPVTATDPAVEAMWQRLHDRDDPEAAHGRSHRSPQEQAHADNHARYMIPLPQQLDYLAAAGFHGIDVYWKHLENVVYGGFRPA